MFTENDLDTLTNATGLQEAEIYSHPTLGNEYLECLRLQHSMGRSGALETSTFIGMLRRLGLSAPRRPVVVQETNWRTVKGGTRVIVTPDASKPDKRYAGTYQYVIEMGLLAVLLDGSLSGADEFPKDLVQLAPEVMPAVSVAPTQPTHAPVELCANLHKADDAPLVPDAPTEATVTIDPADPERRSNNPQMTQDWSEFDAGSPVWYRVGKNLCEASFVDIGPTDGHITIAVVTPTKDAEGKQLKDQAGKKLTHLANKVVPEAQTSQLAPLKREKVTK